MNLENSIKDVINQKMNDGTIEKLIQEQLENGVVNALDNLFRSYGDVTKVIEEKVKSVMIPYLENYDYSKYIVKLDSVLVDVLNNTALENKKLLENFKSLITTDDKKEYTTTELFDIWMKYVEKNVKTDGLDIDYDDRVSYESVEVRFNVEYDSDRSWSSFEYATLTFECDHDEDMNFAIRLSRWNGSRDEKWDIRYDSPATTDLKSLRHLNDFEILLMKLTQNHAKLIITEESDWESIVPEAEPEAHFE